MANYNEKKKKKSGLHTDLYQAPASLRVPIKQGGIRPIDEPVNVPRGPVNTKKTYTAKEVLPSYNRVKSEKQTWTGKRFQDVSYAEYKAFAKKSNAPQEIFDRLEQETAMRGSQFYNPYKESTQLAEISDYFREHLGYDGPLDENFISQYSYLDSYNEGNITETGAVSKPSAKTGSVNDWLGYYYNHIRKYREETQATKEEWDGARDHLKRYFEQYQQVNGHAPTLEEFLENFDVTDYSRLKAIDDSLTGEKSVQVLNLGTNYSKDALVGLYYALQNGKDITVDRDYTEDAVNYYMNPVQQTQVVQKYDWSKTDLSQMSEEDKQKYLLQLGREGKKEEQAAFDRAYWQAHYQGNDARISPLDETYGFYHDDNWFEAVDAAIGNEYRSRLGYQANPGEMSKPGKDASYMDWACYDYDQALKYRDKTDEIESAWVSVKKILNESIDIRDYDADGYDAFFSETMASIRAMPEYEVLKSYFGGDDRKTCRFVTASEENLQAMIGRIWKGLSIDEDLDYSDTYADGYEPDFGVESPIEPPLFYDENMKRQAEDYAVDNLAIRNKINESTLQLSKSGSNIGQGGLPVIPDTVAEMSRDWNTPAQDILASIWFAYNGNYYREKLGENYTFEDAAAIDPVLRLSEGSVDTAITGADLMNLSDAMILSGAKGDPITLSMGIVGNAVPGAEHLSEVFDHFYEVLGFDTTETMLARPVDILTYGSTYQKCLDRGESEVDAAKTAFYAATEINAAMNTIPQSYEEIPEIAEPAAEMVSGIQTEEGVLDTIDLISGINEDVMLASGEEDGAASPDMTLFNASLMVGASQWAEPGYAAQTMQLTHDIASGEITPQDVMEGVSAYNAGTIDKVDIALMGINQASVDAWKAQREREKEVSIQERQVITSWGQAMTAGEYTAWKENARRTVSGEFSPYQDNIPENVKTSIGYDAIMEYLDEVEANGLAVDRESVIYAAVNNLLDDENTGYHTSEMMHGRTDFLEEIQSLTSRKTPEAIKNNALATERNLFQALIEGDKYNFLPRLAALTGYVQTDTQRVITLFENNGKWFSAQETDAALTAYFDGGVTYDELQKLVAERKQQYPSAYVNALNNPQAVADRDAHLDEQMAAFAESMTETSGSKAAALAFVNQDGDFNEFSEKYPEIAQEIDFDFLRRNVQNDEELKTLVLERLESIGDGSGGYSFTEEQLDAAEKVVQLCKDLGPESFWLAAMDSAMLKELSGGAIDLEAVGLGDLGPSGILNAIDSNWTAPYGMNPGEENIIDTIFGGISKGIGGVIDIPSTVLEVIRHGLDNATGGWYTENVANRNIFTRTAMRSAQTYQEIRQEESEYQANVRTTAEAFLYEGVSEFTRNLLTSVAGKVMAGGVEKVLYSGTPMSASAKMMGLNSALTGFADVDMAINSAIRLAGRMPFALGVFSRDVMENINSGEPYYKAVIKGFLSAGIELGTEAMPLEKMLSFNIGGTKLIDRALNTVDGHSVMALAWIGNSAKAIVTEIGEEETSMILGRLVDFGEAALSGEEPSLAWANAWEGLEDEARATAASTFFTTMLFAALDLGGMTSQYVHASMETGIDADPNILMLNMAVDFSEARKEDAFEADDNSSKNSNAEEPERMTVPKENFGQFPLEAQAEDTGYNPAKDVPVFKRTQTDIVEQEQRAQVEMQGNKPKSADAEELASKPEDEYTASDRRLEEASKAYFKAPTDENLQAAMDAAKELDVQPVESAQIATENAEQTEVEERDAPSAGPVTEASGASESIVSNTQAAIKNEVTAGNAPVQPDNSAETAMAPGAQRVFNYLENSRNAVESSIAQFAANKAAETALTTDPGLKAKRSGIAAVELKLAETEREIQAINDVQIAQQNNLNKMFRAAADELIDPTGNSPEVLNARMALTQSIGARKSKISELIQKADLLKAEIQQKKDELTQSEAEIEEAAKAESIKMTEDAIKELQKKAKEELDEMESEREAEVNYKRMNAAGLEMSGPATNAQIKAADEEYAASNAKALEAYSRGEIGVEAYTDPGNYPPLLVFDRREDEWKDDSNSRQAEADEEARRHQRLVEDYRETSGIRSGVFPVSADIYDFIEDAMKRDIGGVDSTQIYSVRVDASRAEETFDPDILQSEVDGQTGAAEAYDNLDLVGSNGSIEGQAARMLSNAIEAGISRKTYTGVKFDHVTENDQFLIFKQAQDQQEEVVRAREYERLRKKDKNGRSQLAVLGDRAHEAVQHYDRVREEYAAAVSTLSEAKSLAEAGLKSGKNDRELLRDYRKASENAEMLKIQLTNATANARAHFSRYKNAVNLIKAGKPAQVRADNRYYVLDKSKLVSVRNEIYEKAENKARAEFDENVAPLSEDARVIWLVTEHMRRENSNDPEYEKELRARYALDSASKDISVEAYNMILDETMAEESRKALRGALSVLKGKEAVDAFVNAHGGYAEPGSKKAGKGFASFTPDSDKDVVYYVSEEAAQKYIPDAKEYEAMRKQIGLKQTRAQYNATLKERVYEYAEKKELTPEQRDSLLRELGALPPVQTGYRRKGYYMRDSDDTHELVINDKFFADEGVNGWLKDDEGNYSVYFAKQRLREKLKQMEKALEIGASEEANGNGEHGKSGVEYRLNLKGNAITVTFINESGARVVRNWGEVYPNAGIDSSGISTAGRWTPSYDWLMDNAVEISCRFFCVNRKRGEPNDSRVTYLLTGDGMRGKYADSLDSERTQDEIAYMRTRKELEQERDYLEKAKDRLGFDGRMNAHFDRLYHHAQFNLAKHDYREALKKVMAPRRMELLSKYSDDAMAAKARMDGYAKMIRDDENRFASGSDFDFEKAKRNAPVLSKSARSAESTPKTAKDNLDAAIARYHELGRDVYQGINQFTAEREALAKVISQLREQVEQEETAREEALEARLPRYIARDVEDIRSRIDAAADSREKAEDFYYDLATLKNMTDDGLDVSGLRSKVISEYHDFVMKDMSLEEKADYLSAITQKAKIDNGSSYVIDQNADYEAQLTDIIRQIASRESDQQKKRLKSISRKAGQYRSARGVQNALAELEAMEKAEMDVAEVRNRLQKNLDAMNGGNPNQEKINQTIDSVQDEVLKVDLQYFSQTEPDATLKEVNDKMTESGAFEMSESSIPANRDVDTGFNKMVAAIESANDVIKNAEALESTVKEIYDLGLAIKGLNDDVESLKSSVNKAGGRIAEIKERMIELESGGELFHDIGRTAEFNSLHSELRRLEHGLFARKTQKGEAVTRRNELKTRQQALSMAVLASDLSNNILNNKAVFDPAKLATPHKKAMFSDGRISGREMLSKVAAAADKNRIDGRLTVHTPEQLAEYYGTAIDEKTLAFDYAVSSELNRQVKDMKKAQILLNFEKAWLNRQTGKNSEEKLNAARKTAIDDIAALNPPKGYTEEDYKREGRNQRRSIDIVQNFENMLKQRYQDSKAVEVEYQVADQQLETLSAAIKRGEEAVHNYFNLSSKGLNGVMDGSNGGHTPHAVMQIDLAMILDAAKKKNPAHVISTTVDTAPRVIDKFLGKNADIFNSRYTAPVMEANGRIARHKGEIQRTMETLHLTDASAQAVTYAIDAGMNEAEIRETYPAFADDVIAAVSTVKKIFEELHEMQNVSLVRNGIDPVKRRSNYVPHIREEKNPVLRTLGINTSYDELPTALLGHTFDTIPAHEFSQHLLAREADNLDECILDIREIVSRYADSTLPLVYQTDNIIRLNDLIEAVGKNVEYGDDLSHSKGRLSIFRRFLEYYRDSVSGKKVGLIDRAAESKFGRKYYGVVKALTKAKGLSATLGNASVVAANVIPLNMFFAMDPVNTIKATYQTILHRAFGVDDGVLNRSDFYASRFQERRNANTAFERAINVGYKPAGWIDELVTEIGFRSRYNNSLARNGAEVDLRQVAVNADNFLNRIMGDKNTGMKPMAYSTHWGSIALQFTQEAVNNLSFIVNDMAAYSGVRKGNILSYITGSAKALAALIAMFFGGYWLNKGIGRTIALDPYGAYEKAKAGADEGASASDIAQDTAANFADAINPISSVTEDGLLGMPAVSGIVDVGEPIVNLLFGKDEKWAENLAEGLFDWVPGSVAIKRLWDTGKVASQGYASTDSGRIKYAFEPTPGNIVKSSLFGTNASNSGQAYVNSGYRSLSETQTEQMLNLISMGVSSPVAYDAIITGQERGALQDKISQGKAIGADVSEFEDKLDELTNNATFPSNISPYANESMTKSWMRKALKIWRETGEEVYPKEISLSTNDYGLDDGDEVRRGINRNGRFTELSPEQQETMNKEYMRGYKVILKTYDDPNVIKDQLSQLTSRIRAKYGKGGV